ncbi:Gfo/Idh/MocA family protein [Curtobacterium sp. Csp2]|uniref:Gfo/Idh/MocA family protein n=1 Tax=Curtobacterium sp. Csp2 TaxID=2495430 RepID=UPI0034A0CF65
MTRTGRVGVGFIGAGMISEQYLTNLTTFPDVEVVRIGDIDTARAAESAAKWGVPASGTGEDVLADPDVEIVVNLTLPATHVEVSTAALRAGKHVWSEKPIGVDRESAAGLVALADELGLRLGIAPDTVLGTGWQTAKRAIEAGVIGTPLTAVTSMQWQGPDVFHPNASFLYAKGAGPLFDIGPYYFTALVHLLGPVESVVATGSRSRETRQLVVGPNAGQEFPVEVPTHVSVLTSFEQGGNAQSLLSFDTPLFRHGVFEVNGTEGTIVLPDPNTFGGGHPIRIARPLGKDVSTSRSRSSRTGRRSPTRSRRSVAASACSTWPARSAVAARTSPPARSGTTSSTRWSPSRSRSPAARSSRSRRPSRRSRRCPRASTRSPRPWKARPPRCR